MPSVNGLPSVTEILKDVGLVEDYAFLRAPVRDKASRRGKALHLSIQWHHEGVLDEDSVPGDVRYGFDAYREFYEASLLAHRHSELELFHPWGFVGHLDLVYEVPDVGIEIVDLKHSDSVDLDGAALQLAGYGLLWDAVYPDNPHRRRRVLQIPRSTGSVKPHDVTDGHATQVFTAAFMIYTEKRRRK